MTCLGSTLSLLFMFLSFVAMCMCGAIAGFGMFYFASASTNMAAFGLGDLGIVLAISGSSMFLVKFLGLCGTAMESKWMTRFFYIFLGIGLALQGCGGIYALVREARVEKSAAASWVKASDLAREAVQKKNMCCGFYDRSEDLRCTHLYFDSCGQKLVELQSSSLKLVSSLVCITTVLDVFLLVISIFLAKIYARQEAKYKKDVQERQNIFKTSQLKS